MYIQSACLSSQIHFQISIMSLATTTNTMSTSLQQALVADQTTTTTTTTRKTGGFESCFAQGLDLSEFTAASTAEPQTSHAAVLLQIKQSEALIKHNEEQEELRMQQVVRERVQALQQQATNSDNNDNELIGALVGMHRSDHSVIESKHHRKIRVKKASKNSTQKQTTKKVRVVKKSNSRKH